MAAVSDPGRVPRRRYIVFGLLALMTLLNYLDRTVLSVAMPVIRDAFNLTPVQVGYLLSSFIWTYALCMLPSGMLVDRIGTRRMAAGCLALWSGATVLSGLAPGYGALFVTRLLLGAGEAPTFPVGARVVREWAPIGERGFTMSLLTSGITVGTAVGSLTIAWLVEIASWRTAFVISGAFGFAWLCAWLLLFHQPERARWLPEAERRMILARRSQEPGTAGRAMGLRYLLGFRTMWGLFLTQGCANYTQYFLLTWLPIYLVQSRGLRLLASGFDLTVTYLGATLLILIIGWISDRVLTARAVEAGHRRYAVVVLLLLATAMAYAPFAESKMVLLLLIGLAIACVNSVFTMQWSLTNDLLRDSGSVGTAIAVVQMGGQLFGLAAPIATGYIVAATGGFTGAFLLAGALLLCGAVTALTMTRRPITSLSTEATSRDRGRAERLRAGTS